VCGDGRREVLGFAVGDSEDGAFWTQFLRSLKARGLAGVQVIADASTCAKPSAPSWPARRYSAAGSTPPQRPAPSAQGVGRDGRDRHPHDFAQPDAAHVHEQLDVIAGMLGRQFRKLEAMLRDAAGKLLVFTAFPVSHWKKVWSTNPLERLNTAATYTTPRDVTRCVVRAQLLLAERSDSGRAQAANATGYLLADLRPPAH
jgi:putative transposase